MVRLIRWLLGYVDIEYKNGFIDGFINDAYLAGVEIFDISIRDNVISAKCRLGSYKRLCRIAKKHAGKITIKSRHGIVFPIMSLRSRMGIAVGMLLAILIFCFLQGFVWQVDIVGNDRVTSSQISQVLEQAGLKRGVPWHRVDSDYVESLILAGFEDISWAHINRLGSVARVELCETIPKPRMYNKGGIYNVVAKSDGVIVSIVANEGWSCVKAGDGVVSGDLLISGIHKTDEKTNSAFAHARGTVIAEVCEPFSMTVNRLQRRRAYIEDKGYVELYFFGLTIPLHLPFSKSLDVDIKTSESLVKLNNRSLPIGVIHKNARRFYIEERVLTDEELLALTRRQIANELAIKYDNAEIISQDIDISLNSTNSSAKGSVILVMDIGEEQQVIKK